MNRNALETLRETLWRRPLTPEEQRPLRAWLAAHPEEAAEWELELALSARLREQPVRAVASNFTARVLQAVVAEERARERTRRTGWGAIPFFRRLALAGGLAAAAVISVQQYRVAEHQEMVRNVMSLSDAVTVPEMEWLRDFDAIQKLGQVPPMDAELLEALQ